MAQNDMKELAIVVKADVQGSAEAVKQSLETVSYTHLDVYKRQGWSWAARRP